MSTAVKALLSLLLVPVATFSQGLDSNELAVWELEEAYYRYAKNNDPEAYMSLFHENVIGWPALDVAPKGKTEVSQWIDAVHADPAEIWNYALNRLAIESFGEVVVVHYLLREFVLSVESGEELRSNLYKISHTWQRYGNRWQIISGMGAKQE